MKIKLQKIPNSTWEKLIAIQRKKESWNMMTIINECIDLGANYMLKKLNKKPADAQQQAPEDNPQIEYQKDLERNIEIAKTKWANEGLD